MSCSGMSGGTEEEAFVIHNVLTELHPTRSLHRVAVTVGKKAEFNESSPRVTDSRRACYLQIVFR